MNHKVTLVGMNDDGCVSLGSRAFNRITESQVLFGSKRLLRFFDDYQGEKHLIDGKISAVIEQICSYSAYQSVAVLASGDPLFYGIGRLLVKKLGTQHCEILPSPSAMQWAFAKIGESHQNAAIISFHGRSLKGLLTRSREYSLVGLFTDDTNTPQAIGKHLQSYDAADQWQVTVCESLCSTEENIWQGTVDELSNWPDKFAINVVLLKRTDPIWSAPSPLSFVDESQYEKKTPKAGLITKAESRVIILSKLSLAPNGCFWDIGTASGSIAIEASRLMPKGAIYAIESDAECQRLCKTNIIHHQADNLSVVPGLAPEVLHDLPSPSSIFIGGSRGRMREIVQVCLQKKQPGAPIVVSAVTLESIQELTEIAKDFKLSLDFTLISASRSVPVAKKYLRYQALNPIHIFTLQDHQ